MIRIREEQLQDIEAISKLNVRAFGQPQEAELVDRMRQVCNDLLSMVAMMSDQVVGHILFSPASIEGLERTVQGMALAPMAVLPEFQRQGIGSELVRAGIEQLQERQCPFIIVLGHAEYYPRFGFESASNYGIRCEWDVPDEAFMILILKENDMSGITGVARYRPEYNEAM
jgi:putative acetyltransferase